MEPTSPTTASSKPFHHTDQQHHDQTKTSQRSTPTPNTCTTNRPTPYLIITNISKRQNIKNLLQLAAAHGCPTVFVVGQRAFEFDPNSNNTDLPPVIQQGVRSGKMKICKFDKLEECVAYIKSLPCSLVVDTASTSNNDDATKYEAKTTTIPIIGVEIDNTSLNLESEPFTTTSVAFMMGNEGSGMSDKQMKYCDGFVRISQYGGGTASLNVSVAAGIVLHRFSCWSLRAR